MSSSTAPLVGFGDPDIAAHFAPFHVEVTAGDVYPDWDDGGPLGAIRQIAGSSGRFDVYNGGFGPSRLTLSIWFDTRADYLRFRGMYRARTPGTLSLLAQFTSHEGPIRTHLGRQYEQFHHTLIDRIESPLNRLDGGVECQAVFLRAEGD